jgi:hypothetical protein
MQGQNRSLAGGVRVLAVLCQTTQDKDCIALLVVPKDKMMAVLDALAPDVAVKTSNGCS